MRLLLAFVLLAVGCTGGDAGAEPTDQTTTDSVVPDRTVPGGADRSAELIGSWKITSYAVSDGADPTAVIAGEAPAQIIFGTDGALRYHTGCNAGDGVYTTAGIYHPPVANHDDEPSGQALSLSELAADSMLCVGPLGKQHARLSEALRLTTSFEVTDARLRLVGATSRIEAERP